MATDEEVKTQEVIEPEQKAEEVKEVVAEKAEVTPEVVEETPLSVEDIVSGTKKTPIGVQKRIDELTREKYEARREAEYWKEKAEKPANVSQTSERPLPPVWADFGSSEDYQKAVVAYEDKVDAWKGEQGKGKALEAEMQKEMADNYAKFNAKAGAMRAKYPDFEETVSQPIFSTLLINEIYASDYGPEIGYYLSKNPSEANRISNLKPNMISKEIGKLEVKFSEALTRKTSNAPPPITPIKGDDVPVKDTSKMTDAEWYEWDRQQRMKKFQTKK